MFYHYRQNNSGGIFAFEENKFTTNVVIEAPSAVVADTILETLGGYFYGCIDGSDCQCCGDRWYKADEPGDSTPMIHGKSPTEFEESLGKRFPNGNRKWLAEGRPEVYIHYLDGRIEAFGHFSIKK